MVVAAASAVLHMTKLQRTRPEPQVALSPLELLVGRVIEVTIYHLNGC
jgi:hypothetical protein